MQRNPLIRFTLAAATLLVCAPGIHAQDFPNKAISIVVPYPPGASFDLAARLLAEVMGKNIGQRVVVDNKPGAGGIVGANFVKDSRPDGHTLFQAFVGTHAVLEALQPIPYDPVRDFDPVSQTNSFANILTVATGSQFKNVADVITVARNNPAGVTYGSQGIGSGTHIIGEMWAAAAKAKLVHVPYKGAAPMLVDVVANRVDIGFATFGSANEYVKDGKVRFLVIAAKQRWNGLPDVPTMAEAGYPGIDLDVWYGLAAPAGTPRAVIDYLNRAVAQASRDAGMVARLKVAGVDVVTGTPEEFRALWIAERNRWGKVIKTLGIKGE
ncbi:MAG: Bug family tripartite tricarboxylate transporter substrate binding protein [Burkholderiales bacterium]